MVAGMKRRDVEAALHAAGCHPLGSGRGSHEKWRCPCGQHSANLPRHRDISPGVIKDIQIRLACLPKGWL